MGHRVFHPLGVSVKINPEKAAGFGNVATGLRHCGVTRFVFDQLEAISKHQLEEADIWMDMPLDGLTDARKLGFAWHLFLSGAAHLKGSPTSVQLDEWPVVSCMHHIKGSACALLTFRDTQTAKKPTGSTS